MKEEGGNKEGKGKMMEGGGNKEGEGESEEKGVRQNLKKREGKVESCHKGDKGKREKERRGW